MQWYGLKSTSRTIRQFFCIIRRRKSYYITTPIFYVNAKPHIGHLYTASLGDAAFRWQKLKSNHEFLGKFSTGTDEHGQKVWEAAKKMKIDPIEFCNKNSTNFLKLFELCGIDATTFIRTTNPTHEEVVEQFWNVLNDKGFIYKGDYEGWYSKNDECFVPLINTKEVVDGKTGAIKRISIESGHEVTWTKESNYLFKLTAVADRVQDWLHSDKSPLHPRIAINVTKHWFENIQDLSISRESSRAPWGITVPNDPTQTIYVWLDALINYLTVVEWPNHHEKYWPPDVQLLGVDILKFHALYWPAFLMAAGLELPRKLIVHQHWLLGDEKMSKSKGNVVDPFELCQHTNSEAVRYFLLRQNTIEENSNFDLEIMKQYINDDLPNTLGNCLYRATAPKLNPRRIYPHFNENSLTRLVSPENSENLISTVKNLSSSVQEHYDNFMFHRVSKELFDAVRMANLLVHENQLWNYDQENEMQLQTLNSVMYCVYESLRVTSILLQPLIPTLSNKVLDQLSIPANERTFKDAESCFNDKYCGQKLHSNREILIKRIK